MRDIKDLLHHPKSTHKGQSRGVNYTVYMLHIQTTYAPLTLLVYICPIYTNHEFTYALISRPFLRFGSM